MANKTETPFGSVPMRTIDQHALAKKTPAAVQYGAMALASWTSGKMVTAEEYDAAIADFRKATAGKKG